MSLHEIIRLKVHIIDESDSLLENTARKILHAVELDRCKTVKDICTELSHSMGFSDSDCANLSFLVWVNDFLVPDWTTSRIFHDNEEITFRIVQKGTSELQQKRKHKIRERSNSKPRDHFLQVLTSLDTPSPSSSSIPSVEIPPQPAVITAKPAPKPTPKSAPSHIRFHQSSSSSSSSSDSDSEPAKVPKLTPQTPPTITPGMTCADLRIPAGPPNIPKSALPSKRKSRPEPPQIFYRNTRGPLENRSVILSPLKTPRPDYNCVYKQARHPERYPPLRHAIMQPGDILAYRVLQLGESGPEASEWMFAKVLSFSEGDLCVRVLIGKANGLEGEEQRFDLEEASGEESELRLTWNECIEPRLVMD